MKNGEVVSELYGTYMGYLDFDGKRYYDTRDTKNFDPVAIPLTETATKILGSMPVVLESDASKRIDSQALLKGDVE